jgi:hypothetical protein
MASFQSDDWAAGAAENLSWGLHLAVWTRDQAALADLGAVLRQLGRHGPVLDAMTLTVDAGLAAMTGAEAEALNLYRRALDAWGSLELRFTVALIGIDMATLLDQSNPEVQAAVADSRSILTELGARPILARLDEVTGGSRTADGSATDGAAADDSATDGSAPVAVGESEVTAG